VTKPPPSHTLNANITLVELLQVLKTLQRNKAVGLDGMKDEFILDAGELFTHATIDNVQLLFGGGLSGILFH
jgi:hypothetical protein